MKGLKKLILTTVSLVFLTTSFAQDDSTKVNEIMPYNITFTIAEEFQLYFKDLTEANDFLNEDSISEIFAQESYRQVKESIEKKTNCIILPVETLSGRVSYNDFGFPIGNRKKAVRKSNAPYYLKLNITLNSRNVIDDNASLDDKNSYKKRKMKAQIVIKAKFYDNVGEEVFKSEGKAKGTEWIVTDELKIFGNLTIKGNQQQVNHFQIFEVLEGAIIGLEKTLPSKL